MKPGTVVKLKSGGPDMTVESKEDGTISCVWCVSMGASAYGRDKFPADALVVVSAE